MPLGPQQLAGLIESHAATMRLWIRSRCASSEDVVQEAFCRLATEEPPPREPVAWLYRVCRNLADKQRLSDQRRRVREQKRARLEVEGGHAVDTLELAEVVAALDEIEPELREVLVARIWGQLPLEEIGSISGVSTATAHRRYQAGLEALRAKLDPKCEKLR